MLVALLLLSAGCTPTDDKPDADGDGFAEDEDCDDGDAAINPAAVEVCDGADVDEDCDGLADDDDPGVDDAGTTRAWKDSDGDGAGDPGESAFFCDVPRDHVLVATDCDDADPTVIGASPWFLDSDGDRYGDPAHAETACEPSPGYVADGTDCDDAQSDVNPSAWEYCDGEDDDCDSVVDEPDALDVATWYADADGDGHGDPGTSVVACDAPAAHVADATDCDDTRADVSPALVEVCDAANTDEDCNGLADDADLGALAEGMSRFHLDFDADGYGDPATPATTCDAPAGYVSDATDCDDRLAAVNPGATEVCDADHSDEDCDGIAEDGDPSLDLTTRTTWYADTDGDGYGDPASTQLNCRELRDHVTTGTDCDDANAAVNPGGAEVCDAADVDEDCDGLADDADASVRTSTWHSYYLDGDGDGYGDAAAVGYACDGLAGYAAGAGDCDLADDTVFPGAEDTCGDAVDQDCDGETACVRDTDEAYRKFVGEAENDGLGFVIAAGGDPNGDGVEELLLGAPQSDRGATASGAAWVIAGGGTGDLPVSGAEAVLVGEATSDLAGYCLASAGDLDGDGVDDMVVGAPGHDGAASSAGALYVVRGPASGTVSLATAYAVVTGEAASSLAGATCRPAGDVDGDGQVDLLVGAYAYSSYKGGAYLLTGVSAGTSSLASATARLYGETTGDEAGYAIDGAGDVNGDGFDDLLVAATKDDDIAVNSGAAYVVLGPQTGSASLSTADAKRRGQALADMAGTAVRGVGDLDGDGYDDIAIGAENAGSYGVVYLERGPITGTASLSTADARIEGTAGYLGFLNAVEGRDIDGDGMSDVVVGNNGSTSGSTAGQAFLHFGPLSGTLTTDDADATFQGLDSGALLGRSVTFVGSQDGLGTYDLLTSAVGDDEGASSAGAAYLFSLSDF